MLEDVCDGGGYLFCSLLKDSSWEFVWISRFILVEIFQLFNYPVCANIKRGMLHYNEGSITGMGYLSLVNTKVNWLLRAFALSRSFVIGLSFTLRVGMPMFSRLFALMNDQNSFGFGFKLDCHQLGCLYRNCRKLPMV